MSENTGLHASHETTSTGAQENRVEAPGEKVEGIESRPERVLQLLEGTPKEATPDQDPSPPVIAPVPGVTAVVAQEPALRPPPAQEAYRAGSLQFTLPGPSPFPAAKSFASRRAYGRTGKLNLFGKPGAVPPYPAERFVPEPAGLFGRVKEADHRDVLGAEVLWNIAHDFEVAAAAFHQIAIAPEDVDLGEVAQFLSVA